MWRSFEFLVQLVKVIQESQKPPEKKDSIAL